MRTAPGKRESRWAEAVQTAVERRRQFIPQLALQPQVSIMVAQLGLRVRPLTTTSTAARRASLPAVGNGCRPLMAAGGRSEAAESGSAGPRQLVGKVVGLEGGVRAQGGVREAVTALQKRPKIGCRVAGPAVGLEQQGAVKER